MNEDERAQTTVPDTSGEHKSIDYKPTDRDRRLLPTATMWNCVRGELSNPLGVYTNSVQAHSSLRASCRRRLANTSVTEIRSVWRAVYYSTDF